jgi:hypothetical protein
MTILNDNAENRTVNIAANIFCNQLLNIGRKKPYIRQNIKIGAVMLRSKIITQRPSKQKLLKP